MRKIEAAVMLAMAVFVVAFLWLMWTVAGEVNKQAAECKTLGGALVKGAGGWVCVPRLN